VLHPYAQRERTTHIQGTFSGFQGTFSGIQGTFSGIQGIFSAMQGTHNARARRTTQKHNAHAPFFPNTRHTYCSPPRGRAPATPAKGRRARS
jgi:hypothetical protein